jgi:ABC-type xylose transport system permease subunit
MREGLFLLRLMMTLASLAPLFVLTAVRGLSKLGDKWTWIGAAVLVVVPNIVLWLRYYVARHENDRGRIEVESATDNREHLLVYLFAVLMPLYQSTFTSCREIAANLLVIVFVVYLFMHMNLHYMNVIFAVFGYRVFSVETSGTQVVLLTKRTSLVRGQTLTPFRLSNTLYIDP